VREREGGMEYRGRATEARGEGRGGEGRKSIPFFIVKCWQL
jgi:hypothetical protein